MTRAALILSVGLALGGFLLGGVYQTSGGPGATHVVNKFTGGVRFCRGVVCEPARVPVAEPPLDDPFADLIPKDSK